MKEKAVFVSWEYSRGRVEVGDRISYGVITHIQSLPDCEYLTVKTDMDDEELREGKGGE